MNALEDWEDNSPGYEPEWEERDDETCSFGCGCNHSVDQDYDRCAMCEEGCGPNEWGPDYDE